MLITAVSTQLLWQLSSTVASHKTPCPFNPQSPTKGHMNYTVLNVYTWFTTVSYTHLTLPTTSALSSAPDSLTF